MLAKHSALSNYKLSLLKQGKALAVVFLDGKELRDKMVPEQNLWENRGTPHSKRFVTVLKYSELRTK